jgi:hypothetical protein
MSTTVTLTIADLLSRNITPAAYEAVAIVLSLMDGTQCSAVNHDTGRSGLPSARTIHLSVDGSVSAENSAGALAPADLATLLQQILDHTPGVPPGLMYSIARALRAVEAPPFESMDAFLKVLKRFERGDRADVVRGLVERFEAAPAPKAPEGTRLERRRTPVIVNDLRKELQAIDRRRYEEQSIVASIPVVALPPHLEGAPMRVVRVSLALGFAVVLACVASADAALSPSMPALPAAVSTVAAPVVLSASTSTEDALPVSVAMPERGAPAVPVKPDVHAPAPRRASTSAKAVSPKKGSRIHVVFRLGWMKHLITIHHDDL